VLKDWGVSFASLTFKFDNDEREYLNFDLPSKEFYDRIDKKAETFALTEVMR